MMFNDELFDKLAQEFTPEAMKNFCLMTSRMYHFMFITFPESPCEYEFQRTWWLDKFIALEKTRLIKNANIDSNERNGI